uniref:Prepilin-type N-terminal cleavage/methylation domain-containing protein n=1 Tax=candidate division WOR-3 bacterium TaxID=2052148 RepID=A0A7V3PSA7_UNCW3
MGKRLYLTRCRQLSIMKFVPSRVFANRGFTLVELLVVISVIGILLAFFVPTMISRVTTNARRTATLQEMNVIREAIMGNPDLRIGGEVAGYGFKQDVGRLPRDLVELVTKNPFEGIYAQRMYVGKETLPSWDPYIQKGWNGPYLREDGEMGYLYDAWGTEYKYWIENNETLGLKSAGPDGLFWGQPGAVKDDDIKVRF